MPGAAYPKPTNEKIGRDKAVFGWTDLPAINPNPVPPLPEEVRWTDTGIEFWRRLWESPQSTQWATELHPTVIRYVALYERMIGQKDLSGPTMNSMTQVEDRLGLNPKAMLQLRWRLRPGEPEPQGLAVVTPIVAKSKRPDPRG